MAWAFEAWKALQFRLWAILLIAPTQPMEPTWLDVLGRGVAWLWRPFHTSERQRLHVDIIAPQRTEDMRPSVLYEQIPKSEIVSLSATKGGGRCGDSPCRRTDATASEVQLTATEFKALLCNFIQPARCSLA